MHIHVSMTSSKVTKHNVLCGYSLNNLSVTVTKPSVCIVLYCLLTKLVWPTAKVYGMWQVANRPTKTFFSVDYWTGLATIGVSVHLHNLALLFALMQLLKKNLKWKEYFLLSSLKLYRMQSIMPCCWGVLMSLMCGHIISVKISWK